MKSYEMVETLSEKTNVSLAEAKDALEKSNWDMLDAAIYIEKNKANRNSSGPQMPNNGFAGSHLHEDKGQYSNPGYTHFSGAPNGQPFPNGQPPFGRPPFNPPFGGPNGHVPPYDPHFNRPPVSVGEMLGRLFGKMEILVNKAFFDSFVVSKNGRRIFQIPLLVFLIALLCGVFPVAFLLVIGIMCGFQYSFEGRSVGKEPLNHFFNNAKNAADKMKNDFHTEYDKMKNDFQKGVDDTKQ